MSTQTEILPEQPISGSAFRALKNRNFSLFFWGQLVSMIGTWSQMLAISWLIWKMTGSAMWLGIAGFVTQIPCLILGLPGGVVADRYDRLRSLTFMQVMCMLQAIVLAWLTFTGKVQLWQVIGLGFFLGSVYAFEAPIRQAFVVDVVGKRDLLNAVSIVAAMFHLTRMLGPTVAGAIVAWKGEGICFAFNAVTFLALISALFFVRRSEMHNPLRTNESMLHSIKEGLKEAHRIKEAIPSFVLVALLAGIGLQYVTLLPMFADKVLGGGAEVLGWLMGASGAGSFIGALWLAKRRSSEGLLQLAVYMAILSSLTLVSLGFISKFYAALPVMLIMGACLTIAFSAVGTLLQHRTSDHMRGRIMSLYSMTFMGLGPFGSLAAGGLAKAFGIQTAIVSLGLTVLLIGGIVWLRTKKASRTSN